MSISMKRGAKSPTPSQPLFSLSAGILSTLSLSAGQDYTSNVAIDPITLMINECITISSAMRKMTRWSQSGVAAILGAGDLFGSGDDDNLANNLVLSSNISNSRTGNKQIQDNPLTASFLQLRSILTDATDLYELDSLTLMQPFLMVIKSSSTSGNITALALNAISKFLNYEILSLKSNNLKATLIQIISSLTHCRFEAADQNSDDAVLLKVLRLLEIIIECPLSNLLPDESISEVVQTCLSLACNKKRSEVLRKAAEMAMLSITFRIFTCLKDIEPETENIDDLQTNIQDTKLPEDIIGGTDAVTESANLEPIEVDNAQHKEQKSETNINSYASADESFGIVCINDFLRILVSMISPFNQYQHMESTRVLALSLITTAIQVSGNEIPLHPSLYNLVSDPICKHVLQIITTAESPALLYAALQLFSTLAIVLGRHLNAQIELSLTLIFQCIFPGSDKKRSDRIENTNITKRTALSKEILIESLSLLWTRSPKFFTELFIDYDCDFDKSDLATKVLEYLCRLALPESAMITTDNVPPICLEGILSLISAINDRIKTLNSDITKQPIHNSIKNRNQKTAFIKCTEVLNENPKLGIKALAENGFIKDADNIDEVAHFFFSKSGRLNKKVLGEFLAKPSNTELFKKFMDLFDFADLRVDEALRLLLKAFRLPGESQQIERVVEIFASKYVADQPPLTGDEEEEVVRPDRDSVFILSYSVIMLNTDLHNPQVKQHMFLEDYKRNVRGINNGKDFPEWYLSKIYHSIKDREIIMPEEHHGTDKWFDDAWHNLVSTQTNLEEHQELSLVQFCQFDKALFEVSVHRIIDTLVSVFREASDDQIITSLMSSIDKCANICLYYNLNDAVDKLIGSLADLTALTDKSHRMGIRDETQREEIPITQIKLENKDSPIVVSELSVWFGRDFKAQLSTVVLFRLLRKTNCVISLSWEKVIKIVLALFENCLINPNLFIEFQKKIKLGVIADVKPKYIINRVKPVNNSGLLSTFSSFLKGYSDEPAEPTDVEIESTFSTIDCIRSVNIPSIFEMISKSSPENIKYFIELLLANYPEYVDDSKRYYETLTIFLSEILVCFSLLLDHGPTTTKIFQKMESLQNISKKNQLRILAYKLLLFRRGNESIKIADSLNELLGCEKDLLAKNGTYLVQPLLSLIDEDSWCCKDLLLNEDYWKVLRLFASIQKFSMTILEFMEGLIKTPKHDIVPQNYMYLLGLLDEISSLGALGSQYEQETNSSVELLKNENYTKITELAKRSIGLTAELSAIVKGRDFEGMDLSYSLIQALAHQCFNPCREIRSFAMKTLKSTILSSEVRDDYSAYGIFEFGLFPLLTKLANAEVVETDTEGFTVTQLEALSLASKVYLQNLSGFQESERPQIWFGILDHSISFKSSAVNNKHETLFDESVPELLKNMILILQDSKLFTDEQTFWTNTWEKVNSIHSPLRLELAGTLNNADNEKVKDEIPPINESNIATE